VFPAFKWRSK